VSQPVQRFYERMYAEGRPGKLPGGIIGWLFTRLRRFELHRTPASYALLDRGIRLLDIGCGDGSLLALAAAKFEHLSGIDVAPVVIERARAACAREFGKSTRFSFEVADLNAPLPYADEVFDAVTAVAVLEHIFDPYFSVAQIARILKPGGLLVLEVPNLAWLPRRLDVLLGRLPVTGDEEGWDGGHLHYFTFDATSDLLTGSGFTVEYMGSTGIFPGVRNLWPTLLGGNILVKARKRRSTGAP
jgi:SAM-dependent methyltransferase